MTSKDERDARREFSERYALVRGDLLEGMERRVIGDAWGANGFTTRAQADILAAKLNLSSDMSLLDIGSGRGWPGLYLAQRTGCEVVVTDLPVEGLKLAQARADRERLALLGSIAASARHLPFRPDSFDAIVHTDVLC